MHRIVLTGGPGAGKTVVGGVLAAESRGRIVLVPEAATLVYRRLGVRWGQLDAAGRRQLQREIYRVQLEQEQAVATAHPDSAMLLDRGTVDGSAYWPDGPEDYWQALGTTLAAEYARYDAVIWLQTSAAIDAYDAGASNPIRHENPPAAIALDQRLRQLWSGHPHFHEVRASPSIDQKIAAVRDILQRIIGPV